MPQVAIRPAMLRDAGVIEVSASPGEIREVYSRLNNAVALDAGEAEALAILLNDPRSLTYCTADAAAARAIALLNLTEKGVSLEVALESCGMRRGLDRQYSERRFRELLHEGFTMRLQGPGGLTG